IALDSVGNAYIVGYTQIGLPTTPGAFQTVYGGGDSDAYVSKLSDDGSRLLYSSYLGGVGYDIGYGIATGGAGIVCVTGFSSQSNTAESDSVGTFPTTSGSYQETYGWQYEDAFLTKFD